MIPFEAIWRVLYEHGDSEKKKEGTKRFWETRKRRKEEKWDIVRLDGGLI